MDLDKLFFPRSIAVVGASPNASGGKLPYFQVLRRSGYKGRLYPVNPAHQTIDGVNAYASLDDLPEAADLAIAQVPVQRALEVMTSAARKKTGFIHFFTSGFSEIGDRRLEEAMLEQSRAGGTRIIGPNCLGVLCAESGVTFGPLAEKGRPGQVGFVGQSGGVALNFLRMLETRGFEINKAISCGNQIDLGVETFIEYYNHDPGIKVIAAYIEDVKDGRAFLEILKKTTLKKPVIILRGGTTAQGAKAAASHTGALCGESRIFTAAVRQYGGLEVTSLEQLLDVIGLALSQNVPSGYRLGYLGAGGGTSVLLTDAAARHGFILPELEKATQERIYEQIPRVNTSAANPVDLGAPGRSFSVVAHAIRAMGADGNIDMILPYYSFDYLPALTAAHVEAAARTIIDAVGRIQKPVIVIFARQTENSLAVEEARIQIYGLLREAGIPVYPSLDSAIASIRTIVPWKKRAIQAEQNG